MSHGRVLSTERSGIYFDRRMETKRKCKELGFLQLPFATIAYEIYAIIRRKTCGVSHGRVMVFFQVPFATTMPYEPHAVMEEDCRVSLFEETRNVLRTSGGIRVGKRMMMMMHVLMIILIPTVYSKVSHDTCSITLGTECTSGKIRAPHPCTFSAIWDWLNVPCRRGFKNRSK